MNNLYLKNYCFVQNIEVFKEMNSEGVLFRHLIKHTKENKDI